MLIPMKLGANNSRFHSADALERMDSYQIGRIDGQWLNFVPPIQGGKFRTLAEMEVEDDETSPEPSSPESSSDCSCSETEGADNYNLRRRRIRDRETTPPSSVSSTEDLARTKDKATAHLDAVTKEQIDLDIAKYPSLDVVTQQEICWRYRVLYQKLIDEGLFQCNYGAYAVESCRYALLCSGFLLFLQWGWYSISGMFLGMLWHQLVFTVHDAGHLGITHNFHVDTVIGILIADFIGGLSVGWWKRNHNVHHIVTNSPEHDPDIEHMPFFMISHRFFTSLRSSYYERVMQYDAAARVMASLQQYTYYPVMMFGRFNLYRLSWIYLLGGQAPRKGPAWWHRWLEIVGQVFFWTWFGYGVVYKSIPSWSGRVAFVLISHMVTAPLHVQITLSHFAMSTADLGVAESFPQKMLRTTMDVDCPDWLDFIHGGLQFQAVHHLYPRMPRHNLRRAQKLVQEFCKELGIPFALYGFIDGNKQVIGRLADVGRQAAILAECQRHVTEQFAQTGAIDM